MQSQQWYGNEIAEMSPSPSRTCSQNQLQNKKKQLLPRSRCKKKLSEDIIWEVFEILNLLTFPSGVPQPMLHSIEGIPSSGPRPVPPDIRKCQTAVLMDGTRHGMTVASAQLVAPPMSPQHFWWKPSFLTGSALHLGLE